MCVKSRTIACFSSMNTYSEYHLCLFASLCFAFFFHSDCAMLIHFFALHICLDRMMNRRNYNEMTPPCSRIRSRKIEPIDSIICWNKRKSSLILWPTPDRNHQPKWNRSDGPRKLKTKKHLTLESKYKTLIPYIYSFITSDLCAFLTQKVIRADLLGF